MIETLKIKLLDGMYADHDWECDLEIPLDFNLEDLHLAILKAVGFDNDHLYEFRIGTSFYSKAAQSIMCDDALIGETIENLLLQAKGKKLFYMFDYGDSWLFQISKSRKKPFQAEPNVRYPRVSAKVGKKPKQYPDY